MTKNIFYKIVSFTLIFVGATLILSLYSHQAEQLGILQHMHNQNPDGLTMVFTVLLTVPAVIVLFWPLLVRREILLPPVPIGGRYWRVMVTKWRVAFAVSLIGLLILEILV